MSNKCSQCREELDEPGNLTGKHQFVSDCISNLKSKIRELKRKVKPKTELINKVMTISEEVYLSGENSEGLRLYAEDVVFIVVSRPSKS